VTESIPVPPAARAAGRVARALAGAVAVTALDVVLLALALGGFVALLATPRAVALLAVWLAGGVALALLRPVRTHDPVEHDKERGLDLVALLVLPVATPPVAAAGARFGILPWFAHPVVGWLGVALVAIGLGSRIAAMTRLGSRFSPLVAVQRVHHLETGGLYARVRHPGYLGSLTACAGAMLALGSALALPLLIAFAMLLRARIEREEALLEHHFGDEYRAYRQRTGALIPKF